METRQSSPTLALAMATLAFAAAFAGWSLLSPLASRIQAGLGLSEIQISLLIAVPVILGSLLRIPLGILTDRYGGRLVFSLLLLATAPVLLLLSVTQSYELYLFDALLLGSFTGSAAGRRVHDAEADDLFQKVLSDHHVQKPDAEQDHRGNGKPVLYDCLQHQTFPL